MVGSFGVLPVSALVGSAQGLSAPSALGAAGSTHPLTLIDNVGLQTLKLAPHQTIEVIVGLEGRSLGAEQTYRESVGLPALDAAGQRAYVASLEKAQAPIVAAFEHAGATVRYQYHILYNGIDAVASQAVLAQIVKVPGVQRIDAAQQENLLLDNSVPFIFDDATYAQLGADGTGVTIALIDTGIDYTHATFGGSGNPADYAAIDPTLPGSYFPTAKVIGGYDFVGENYDARGAAAPGGTCSNVPVPDPNPLDINGHGTHTASVAAGEEVKVGTTITTYHGVAPGAKIYEYKVFSGCAADGTASTDNANVIAAMERAMDPNQDGDTSDHANIISMSLGGIFGRDTTPDSVAANAAVDLGAVVVASAGNSGNIPYITGSPAAASKVISVAAGNDPGVFVQLVTVAGSNGANGNYESVEAAITPPLSSVGTVSAPLVKVANLACNGNPLPTLTGDIALIPRGTCTFHDKILNAQNAGAVAVVVYNNVAGAPIIMGGSSTGITIPAVMISRADGLSIGAAITSTTTMTLDPSNTLSIPNRLAGFTSAGPRFGDSAIKPDVTAPGVDILSAQVGTGTGSTSVSGTSFSAPHVAGAAAILLQLHPSWKPPEIKAALMNTATDALPDSSTPYPVALMGAGRIRVDVAAKVESLALPGSLSFGVTQADQTGFKGVRSYTEWLTLENKDNHGKFFSLSADFRLSAFDDGSIHMIYPPFVYVPAHHSQKVAFTLVVNYNALSSPELLLNEIDGFLTLTQKGGGDVLRVPFLILPIARADVDLATGGHGSSSDSSLTFKNTGLQSSGVDIFQFGAYSPHQQLIPRTPGAPRDPSDWFDIRYTGARAYDVSFGRILEFGLATYGPWSTASNMETDVYLDANNDGTPDYLVAVLDYGLLTTGTPNGLMASAVCALPSFTCFAEFLVSNANNVAWQTAPIVLDDLNYVGSLFGLPLIDASNPSFSYYVVTTDLQTGYYDVSGRATFNAITPTIDVDLNSFELAPGSMQTVNVVGSGKLLVLFENNIGGTDQSLLVTVSHGHHH